MVQHHPPKPRQFMFVIKIMYDSIKYVRLTSKTDRLTDSTKQHKRETFIGYSNYIANWSRLTVHTYLENPTCTTH